MDCKNIKFNQYSPIMYDWLHLYCTTKAKLKDQITDLSESKAQTPRPRVVVQLSSNLSPYPH